MNTEATRCAHAQCDCPVEAGRRFCSTACQNASSTSKSCKCGHADCGAHAHDKAGSAQRP